MPVVDLITPINFSNNYQRTKLGHLCHRYGSGMVTVQSGCTIVLMWFRLPGSPVFLCIALKTGRSLGTRLYASYVWTTFDNGRSKFKHIGSYWHFVSTTWKSYEPGHTHKLITVTLRQMRRGLVTPSFCSYVKKYVQTWYSGMEHVVFCNHSE